MIRYSICHNNHVLVVSENENENRGKPCPDCGSYATHVLNRYGVEQRLHAAHRYSIKGTAAGLRRVKHWDKALATIEKMEKNHD